MSSNAVVISLLARLCRTFREESSRTIHPALAVKFWSGTQLQLIFVLAAMSIRLWDNEHLLSDMNSYFPSNPFQTMSCEISVDNGHVYRESISAWLAMLISAEVSLYAHVVLAERGRERERERGREGETERESKIES